MFITENLFFNIYKLRSTAKALKTFLTQISIYKTVNQNNTRVLAEKVSINYYHNVAAYTTTQAICPRTVKTLAILDIFGLLHYIWRRPFTGQLK